MTRPIRPSDRLLAVDPGNVDSGFVVIDADCRPIEFGKVDNLTLWRRINGVRGTTSDPIDLTPLEFDAAVIEMVASYGMPVGAEVFETCVVIGQLCETIQRRGVRCERIKRQPVKLHHCHSPRANDATVRQALVDRFAMGQPNHGKGTKADPGWFYGFRADVWQAYALAVYAMDQRAETAHASRPASPLPDEKQTGVSLDTCADSAAQKRSGGDAA